LNKEKEMMMQTMTFEEMKQLQGGNHICTIAAVGFAAAEIGLASAIYTGGWGLVVATVGMGASLFGVMHGCSG
jgi:hypothetical protein